MHHLRHLLLTAILLALPFASRAGDDPFDKKNQIGAPATAAVDPFDSSLELPLPGAKVTEPVKPPQGVKPVLVEGFKGDSWTKYLVAEPRKITFSYTLTPTNKVRPGEVVKLTVTATPREGWYTYPITERTPEMTEGMSLDVQSQGDPELKPLWPITEDAPSLVKEPGIGEVLEHKKEFSWSQDILIDPDSKPGEKSLALHLKIQVCGKDPGSKKGKVCYGPGLYPPIPVKIQVEGTAVALSPELKKRLEMPKPAVKVVGGSALANKSDGKANPTPVTAGKTSPTVVPGNQAIFQSGLLGLLSSAVIGAFLMLLTPCVFPMIPITVNFFIKQSEKEHHNALFTAAIYCGTIIGLLTVVILTFGNVVIYLANDPVFNLVMGAVLVFFALSLFGMYEIELPSWLAQWTSAREAQGGYVGAVFMALTFTITSFTCTGPFLGALMAPVASIKPPLWHLVLAALVYSATFAAPFFFLALFPAMLKKMPKSGNWMNSIKVTMGFLEIAAALKFLSITDFGWFPGDPKLFSYDAVLCTWIALSALCGLYLIGTFRLPHDDPQEHIGVVRMLFAAFFFGFAVYMVPLMWGPHNKPQGVVGDALVAFLPPWLKEASTNGGAVASRISFTKDYDEAYQEAIRDKKLIFIDFTGINCQNCRYNEENVFTHPGVKEVLSKYARVALYTDNVPKKGLSAAEAAAEAARNKAWQDAIADPSLPSYVLLRPDPKGALTPDGKLSGQVLGSTAGQINDVPGFIKFLREPLQQQAELPFHRDYRNAYAEAVRDDRLILIYFGAGYDQNSRYNEANVIPQPEVQKELEKYARVSLTVDRVPAKDLTPQETRQQAERNNKWMEETVGPATPGYVVFRPAREKLFTADGKLKGEVVATYQGQIQDVLAFTRFLANPGVQTAQR